MLPPSVPVLDCAEAKAWEEALFGGDEVKEARAIEEAGQALARRIWLDFNEVGPWPPRPRILVLIGRGHNGADALVAASYLAKLSPGAFFDLVFVHGETRSRPQLARLWRELAPGLRGRWAMPSSLEGRYTVVIDGVFGFGYRPPLPPEAVKWLQVVNALEVDFRAAVDLPSGLGEPDGFFADITYATGILKSPLLAPETARQAGRIRFLDTGLLDGDAAATAAPGVRVLLPSVLQPLRRLRPSVCDKRDFGHLLVLGGSLHYPGAVLMAVRAALSAGAGLVTAFVPEPLVASYAAAVPEAMWVGWPLTPDGGLALEGLYLAQARGERGTAWVIGPGLGREPETLALVEELVRREERPVVLDADALQASIIQAAKGPLVLTPHAGEWERIAPGRRPGEWARERRMIVVAKGSTTRVVDAENEYLSLVGGPVLARGGSGDLLSGMVGGRVAQGRGNLLGATCGAVYWHGAAADWLARNRGATAVRTTDLLDCLPAVLRSFDE